MRTFVLGGGADRKFVRMEVQGRSLVVVKGGNDGTTKKSEKAFGNEAEARTALERLAGEVAKRGFTEQGAAPRPTPKTAPQPAPKTRSAPEVNYALAEALEEEAGEAAPMLPRLGALAPAAAVSTEAKSTSKPKKKTGKKKKQKEKGEGLDLVQIVGLSAMGLVLLGIVGYLFSGLFISPTLVGTWQGSKVNYEVSKSLTYDHYRMSFNDQGHVSVILQQEMGMGGTYRTDGDRLILNLTDVDGSTEERIYKYTLGSVELALFEPDGTPIVKLIRLKQTDPVAASAGGGGGDAVALALPALNPALATEMWVSKDTSFSCRYPAGWESRGGSRPDNTYSWAEFKKGSSQVRIDADISGSLIADIQSPAGNFEDDDEHPVATAHATNQKTVAETYSDYQEGPAQVLEHEGLGEGRIAEFTATGSGLFGSKIRGYRATVLTQNRRVTILCHAPEADWEQLKPTFFAAIQSVSR